MRLLMTTDTVGGVWTFTSELANGLLARGCDVALVSFGRAPSPEQHSWVSRMVIGFPNFVFAASEAPLEWMPENVSAYTAGESLLLGLCKSFQPDALLLSQFCFGALPISLPKVVIAHSDVLSWAAAVGKVPLVDDAWLRTYIALVQRGLDGADVVVAPSQIMLNNLSAHFAVLANVEAIPNGRTLAPVENTVPRKLQAVTAGRMWDVAKNLKVLIECVSPIPLLIAGENDGTIVSDTNVSMLGKLSEIEIQSLFRSSAVYICSSVYEPFGLAPLEAALCGCAVLANDIPSLREVWGDAALYFDDATCLSALLTRLAESPSELAAAQAGSHARASAYTSARMTEQYLQQIESIITALARSEAHAA
jgi:glycogen(starch) synthase